MIGAPTDEQARLSGARGDFVASLPRRLEVLRAALRAVEDQPRDTSRINGLLRRLHALGSAARVLGFASVAEALGEAEKTLRRVARTGPAASDLADVARALDLLPSLVLGAKVSIRPAAAQEPALPTRDFPLSVLVFGPQALADVLAEQGDLRVECERTEEPGKARELSRVFGPDVAVIDADRAGARELVELFVKDPVVEPVPIVVVGDFSSPELATTFIGLGASRVVPKPVSPDLLRRTLIELRDQGGPNWLAREPLGELNVSQLVDRISLEIRRGLVEAVEPMSRSAAVGFGEGTDVMSAVWGAVARLRELVTLKSDGNVRFELTGPEGAVPFAPWADTRRIGERGAKENREGAGVSLQGRRVVVADDDPAVVWFLSGILKAVGAEVYEAHDGERAFELTASLWPDLVVSDVLMPKLDGFSLCHEIKRDVAVRDVPVILLSWKEDLLQRVRELGGDADGYLRKEAAASTVVERLREVLRARARVEQRVASGGEVRGRLDGLTPRLVLELACRAKRDLRVSVRDSSYLYEVQVRAGAPRTAIRSATDGSFERGEAVLAMLLGVSAGRFVIEPDEAPCRAELAGTLHEQLAAPVARARAAQKSLSAGALASVTRVTFDESRVGAYLSCTPEPAQGLLRELLAGASPRELLTSGRTPARLLEAVLSDIARRGGVLLVESTGGGVEDISQTRVPPTVAPPLAAIVAPEPETQSEPAPRTAVAAIEVPAPAAVDDAPPVSQRKPPAIYSQPPDAELASADAGWFSFQIEPSAEPPAARTGTAPLPRAQDPLRQTLTSSSAPPPVDDEAAPGASVPVERGIRPALRTETLGSAGNEAAAARAAVLETAVSVVEPQAALPPSQTPVALKPPRPTSSPTLPRVVVEEDPLAQALLSETPPSPAALPSAGQKSPLSAEASEKRDLQPAAAMPPEVEAADVPAAEAQPEARTETAADAQPAAGTAAEARMEAEAEAAAEARMEAEAEAEPDPTPARVEREPTQGDDKRERARERSATATQPPARALPKAQPAKAREPAPTEEGGGWGRTLVLAALAAGASYFGVTALFGSRGAAPTASPATSIVAPAAVAVVSAVPTATAPAGAKLTVTESPLPPGTELPEGHGLLEIQVADGTAIRVNGEYLGMGPARRVPLKPGQHQLLLGEGAPRSVTVKQGQRTLAVAEGAGSAPAGSP